MSITHRIKDACDVIDDLLVLSGVAGRTLDGAISNITATVTITGGSMRHVPDFANLIGRENVKFNANNNLLVNFPLVEKLQWSEQSL